MPYSGIKLLATENKQQKQTIKQKRNSSYQAQADKCGYVDFA